MIHLNQKNGEKDKILELINSSISKSDYELECLFYDNVINNNNPKINNDNFMSLLKRYKNNPNYISNTTERLTIQLPRDNEKFNNIRILIKGSGAIKNYCNNENLSLIRNNIDFEYKKSRQLDLSINVSSELLETKKTEYVFGFGYTIKDATLFKGKKKKKGKNEEMNLSD